MDWVWADADNIDRLMVASNNKMDGSRKFKLIIILLSVPKTSPRTSPTKNKHFNCHKRHTMHKTVQTKANICETRAAIFSVIYFVDFVLFVAKFIW